MSLADIVARLRAENPDPLEPPPPATAAMLGVGWSVWELAPADSDYPGRGGVVVHVVPHSVHDIETGEAYDRYVVVRADLAGLHWTSLRSDRVQAVTDSCRPNAHTIVGVCQVATRELAGQLDRRRGTVDYERVLELFSLGARLMAVIARPATVLP